VWEGGRAQGLPNETAVPLGWPSVAGDEQLVRFG